MQLSDLFADYACLYIYDESKHTADYNIQWVKQFSAKFYYLRKKM